MTLLQYPTHRPTIVTNALVFGAAVFSLAPLLLTSKIHPMQYLLLIARILFTFTTPLVAKERRLLRIYWVALVTIDVCAGLLAVSAGPTGPLSGFPSPSLIFTALLLSVATAVMSCYLLLVATTRAEEDFERPFSWPSMRISTSQWGKLFTRLSIIAIFLAVPAAFTSAPLFIPYHSAGFFDYFCLANRLILLFSSPLLSGDTDKTDFCEVGQTLQNSYIVALLVALLGTGKFLEPENLDNLFFGIFCVFLVGTVAELGVVSLVCYATEEAQKLFTLPSQLNVALDLNNREAHPMRPEYGSQV
ncbi:hypothetical protein C8F04DRAFT_1095483 [Mycena alexandri]|uniref:Uncharacterized protein n=1 Tax=Mycena alexandri TaxID=1745969 RepID=A0AAD6X5M8_9AGAR|nr:hypothetical protein C8F04DRAFT_1095483 [Mycena alexandri]